MYENIMLSAMLLDKRYRIFPARFEEQGRFVHDGYAVTEYQHRALRAMSATVLARNYEDGSVIAATGTRPSFRLAATAEDA